MEADLRRDLEQLTARLETNRRGHEAEGQMYQVRQTDEDMRPRDRCIR